MQQQKQATPLQSRLAPFLIGHDGLAGAFEQKGTATSSKKSLKPYLSVRKTSRNPQCSRCQRVCTSLGKHIPFLFLRLYPHLI